MAVKVPIFMDNHSTTPVDPRVLEAMLPYFREDFGNAASRNHVFGWKAEKAVEHAREQVGALIGASGREIVWTSGATESINLALKGAAEFYKDKGNHIITGQTEHKATLDTCKRLEKLGCEVTYLPVDKDGIIHPQQVADAIKPNTIVVALMLANNEIGTLHPIAEIGAAIKAKKKDVLFFCDAVQGAGKVPFDVEQAKVDLAAVSGHKMYGPKGVGALYVRRGTRLTPIVTGGAHERGMRAGTENVAGIVGFGEACYLAQKELATEPARLAALRDRMIQGILSSVPDSILNGHPEKRLPHNVNISVKYVEGEAMLLNLDLLGIGASSGSACTSGSLEPSHVLLAMGLPHEVAHGSLRMTLGRSTTQEDVDYVVKALPPIVQRLREMSVFGAAEKPSCDKP